jgi:hypothetical protein
MKYEEFRTLPKEVVDHAFRLFMEMMFKEPNERMAKLVHIENCVQCSDELKQQFIVFVEENVTVQETIPVAHKNLFSNRVRNANLN